MRGVTVVSLNKPRVSGACVVESVSNDDPVLEEYIQSGNYFVDDAGNLYDGDAFELRAPHARNMEIVEPKLKQEQPRPLSPMTQKFQKVWKEDEDVQPASLKFHENDLVTESDAQSQRSLGSQISRDDMSSHQNDHSDQENAELNAERLETSSYSNDELDAFIALQLSTKPKSTSRLRSAGTLARAWTRRLSAKLMRKQSFPAAGDGSSAFRSALDSSSAKCGSAEESGSLRNLSTKMRRNVNDLLNRSPEADIDEYSSFIESSIRTSASLSAALSAFQATVPDSFDSADYIDLDPDDQAVTFSLSVILRAVGRRAPYTGFHVE
eukprot:CAMPEP_0198309020 /NCGR_PEP_ID=MMETSP1450-20131203/1497_1 /TAXON_ID=753684 ORGANISM="Madagascaria erythrocladiodes, Strain CCMP3234" /NCGR_SAMPLE_ID=MMETSP1450 /ASSEMBLY_ACC=CAM_ASM_001115 /LENGTH=323 /DNA_ID=CAMNT_0044011741 /DNA_START=231 /DNA_END=1203 /DNA_ORIENTATION=-